MAIPMQPNVTRFSSALVWGHDLESLRRPGKLDRCDRVFVTGDATPASA
jgi:hypothetical protein